jgi:hypothetical protein
MQVASSIPMPTEENQDRKITRVPAALSAFLAPLHGRQGGNAAHGAAVVNELLAGGTLLTSHTVLGAASVGRACPLSTVSKLQSKLARSQARARLAGGATAAKQPHLLYASQWHVSHPSEEAPASMSSAGIQAEWQVVQGRPACRAGHLQLLRDVAPAAGAAGLSVALRTAGAAAVQQPPASGSVCLSVRPPGNGAGAAAWALFKAARGEHPGASWRGRDADALAPGGQDQAVELAREQRRLPDASADLEDGQIPEAGPAVPAIRGRWRLEQKLAAAHFPYPAAPAKAGAHEAPSSALLGAAHGSMLVAGGLGSLGSLAGTWVAQVGAPLSVLQCASCSHRSSHLCERTTMRCKA